VDVLAYLWGPAADLAFRRGWTHGVLALALWPLTLTGVMLLADRLIRRVRRSGESPPAVPRELLLLSGISIVSHPILDTLNTYGVRWLMPFSGRWFYGDVLFIVDPWLWLALGLGVVLSGRGPARAALVFLAAYAGAMAAMGLAARWSVIRDLAERTGRPVDAIMVSPLPVVPFDRAVVAAQGDEYLVGRFRWLARPRLDPRSVRTFPRGRPDHPAVHAAAATTEGRRFLGWARFPTYQVESRPGGGFLVHIVDLRYRDRAGRGFGSVSIPVALPLVAAPEPAHLPLLTRVERMKR
jgi:inner membrane protein